jgi:hypothetical protein
MVVEYLGMKSKLKTLIAVLLWLGVGAYIYSSVIPIPWKDKLFGRALPQQKMFQGVAWFRFDRKNALEGWEEKVFKGRVIYSVKTDKIGSYLNADSRSTASGIVRWLKFSPKRAPMVSWKWKVVKFPDKKKGLYEDNWWIEKDDFAARFYIIFPKFTFFRFRCLEYVWDKDLPEGTVLQNANFKNLKIVVAESGEANLGKWVKEERNIYEDFRRLFGFEPGNAGAIAIMTDSDNTVSSAETQYNDIGVGYAKE